jgi:hypothetical protein
MDRSLTLGYQRRSLGIARIYYMLTYNDFTYCFGLRVYVFLLSSLTSKAALRGIKRGWWIPVPCGPRLSWGFARVFPPAVIVVWCGYIVLILSESQEFLILEGGAM